MGSKVLVKFALTVSLLASVQSFAVSPTSDLTKSNAPRVQTPYGEVDGIESQDAFGYLGIPYAAAPVGEKRFQAPSAPVAWTQPRKAAKFGPICLQSDYMTKKSKGQEDCLSLNVWRPKMATRPLPVLVFIHGGGNTIGSSSEELGGQALYDGSKLAKNGNIVVTLNYRLGPLGFLAHPSLKSPEGLQGNFAILDQIFALQFVRDSIQNFGGDPANVTVFGESAGAINTLILLASPLSQGLFHRAIVQSGFISELPLPAAEAEANKYAIAAGCTEPAQAATCLRSLTPEKILEAAQKVSSSPLGIGSPTIDGYVLKAGVIDSIKTGLSNKVPVVVGTNRDEFRTLLSAVVDTGPVFTENDYESFIVTQFGRTRGDEVLTEYPANAYLTPKLALEEVLNDFMAHCPAREITRALVQTGSPTYRYVYTHVGDALHYKAYGAGHALELPFVFGTLGLDRTHRERRFSNDVRSYWSAFGELGNPNVKGQPEWPSAANDAYLDLAPKSEAKTGFRNAKCDFWLK